MVDYHVESSNPRKRQSLTYHRQHQPHVYSNDILSELDTDMNTKNINNNISVSSSKKRQRLSLLPKNVSLGAPRLANQPSNLRRQSSFGLPQQPPTIAATTTQQQQTPSVQDLLQQSILRTTGTLNGRKSMAGALPPSSTGRLFMDAAVTTSSQASQQQQQQPLQYRDPRPLRDRQYQLKMQEALFDYLSTNKFDIEMKHQLTAKTLKNPTQKDFVLIFQWLFKRIDPGYKFVRTIEQEVYSLLKALDYPFLESVNKSQISAVGGSNWHVFLGVLYWLLAIAQESSSLDNIGLYGFQTSNQFSSSFSQNKNEEASFNDSIVIKDHEGLEVLFTKYTLKAYQMFLKDSDYNWEQYLNDFTLEYSKHTDEIENNLQRLQIENKEIIVKYQELESHYKQLRNAYERARVLETDVSKYKQFIAGQYKRKAKWPVTIDKIKQDIEFTKKQAKESNEEVAKIVDDLSSRGFTINQIESMQKERATLSCKIDKIIEHINQKYDLIEKQQTLLNQHFTSLNSSIVIFNTALQKYTTFGDISATEIKSFDDSLLRDDRLGLKPNEMIPEIEHLKNRLSSIKTNLTNTLNNQSDIQFKSQNTQDTLDSQVIELQDKLEDLTQSIQTIENELNDCKESFQIDESFKKNQIQRYERDKQQIESKFKDDKRKIESTYLELQEMHSQLSHDRDNESSMLIEKISDCLHYGINARDYIWDLLNGFNFQLNNLVEAERAESLDGKFI